MKNLNQINFQNIKNVGIRVDFNVPTDDLFQGD
jgi:3-phosphoglycerate kinase